MKKFTLLLTLLFVLIGCSSNVRFIQTDEDFVVQAKPNSSKIILRHDQIQRPHRVIGVIEAQLGKKARRPELDAFKAHVKNFREDRLSRLKNLEGQLRLQDRHLSSLTRKPGSV